MANKIRIVNVSTQNKSTLIQRIHSRIKKFFEFQLEKYIALGLVYSGYEVVIGKRFIYLKQCGIYRRNSVKIIQFKIEVIVKILMLLN